MLPTETDVLIVGAGPTGLALAITLQQAGIRHVLVDRLVQGQNTSRAAVIHAHTLDMLATIGVADTLAARGLKLPAFSIKERDRTLLTLPFDTLPGRHNYLLMLPQDATEVVLAERLEALGGRIHRGVAVSCVRQDASGVQALLETSDGTHEIRARHAVGADGMQSVVRKAAGIAFEGETPVQPFVLADVAMDWPLGPREVSLFFAPDGLLVVAPLPDGTYRLVAPVDEAPAHPTAGDMQALLDARGPATQPARIRDVTWSSRFRVHHRLASSFRSGRLFVVGDAAHVHSPAGGQGMNCGLIDACVLGQLLAGVLNGTRPQSALDAYGEMRRPAAARVLALAGRLTAMATLTGTLRRAMRNAVLSAVGHVGPLKSRLLMELSGLSRAHLAQLPVAAPMRTPALSTAKRAFA